MVGLPGRLRLVLPQLRWWLSSVPSARSSSACLKSWISSFASVGVISPGTSASITFGSNWIRARSGLASPLQLSGEQPVLQVVVDPAG